MTPGLDRDLVARFATPTTRPRTWSGPWVKHRLVEAHEIERRIPDRRAGPELIRDTWPLRTIDTFEEMVWQGDVARASVWEDWERVGGVVPFEVSRMHEALAWPGAILVNGRAVEARCLMLWAHAVATGRPLGRILRKRGWSPEAFARRVEDGAERIARHLNARGTRAA